MKKCLTCGCIKNIDSFFKDKSSKDGLKYKCKDCIKTYMNGYNVNNQDKIKEYNQLNKHRYQSLNKTYYQENKELHKLRSHKWRNENPEKIKGYDKKFRNKNKTLFQIKNSIVCRIWGALQKTTPKNQKTIYYLGCNIDFYKNYLESQFIQGMTWENYGSVWEIDHILPISSFNLFLEEEQLIAFNYKNTMPLFKTTKIAKSFGHTDHIGNRNKGKTIHQIK